MKHLARPQDRNGYVMILVMVVMGLVISLCLALLMSVSLLMASARTAGQKEQSHIYAVSLSRAFRERTEGFSYTNPPGKNLNSRKTSLQARLQTAATLSWQSGEILTYELESDALQGSTTVAMYWLDSNNSLTELEITDSGDMAEAAEEFAGVRLYVTVTNTIGKDSSSVITVYRPNIHTKIIHVEGADANGDGQPDSREERTVWTGWQWIYDGQSWEGSDIQ
ncbi:MAG: hypothetical protein ACRDBO_08235 [Lachnospiraceae bacterium]